jgi:hypothetical protein
LLIRVIIQCGSRPYDNLVAGYIFQESKVAVAPGTICYLIKKAESNWWPRLFKNDGKPPLFLKVDLDKWQDEDDKNTRRKFSSSNMRR